MQSYACTVICAGISASGRSIEADADNMTRIDALSAPHDLPRFEPAVHGGQSAAPLRPCRRDVIRESARKEFDAARFETDPAVVCGVTLHPIKPLAAI